MSAPIIHSSVIDRVTVYQRGALVVRTVKAKPGALIVPDLPLLYMQQTLRVIPERGQVSNVHDTCTAEIEAPPPPPDEEALRALYLRRALLNEEIKENKKLVGLVEAITPEKQKSLKWSTLPDYQKWLGVLSDKGPLLASLQKEADQLKADFDALAKDERALVATANYASPPPRFRRGLAFSLAGDGEAPVDVAISYFVTGAVWLPSYTMNIDGDKADLRFAAHVAQATGEDWSDVRLSVCTGNYDGHVRAPELVSWRIGRAQPNQRPAYRPLPPGLSELFVTYDKAVSEHGTPTIGSGGAIRTRGGRVHALGSTTPSQLFDDAEPSPAPPPPDMISDMLMVDDESDEGMMISADESALDSPAMESAVAFGGSARDEITAEAEYESSPQNNTRTGLVASRASRSAPAPFPPAPGVMAKRRKGGGGGPPAEVIGANQVQNKLQGYDAQYLRLIGPDRGGQRGQLIPADPTTHLGTLIDDFDFDANYSTLDKAIRTLDRVAARVAHQPLPPRSIHLSKNRFRRTYTADAPCTLVGDGQYHRVSIKRYPLEHAVAYRAVPHIDEQFYRTSMISGANEPLPDGPIQVYDQGAYLITAAIDGSNDEGKLILSLGPHPAIRVTDRVVRVDQSEKGLINNKSRVEHSVEMTIRSALNVPVKALLYGRIPVPDENATDLEVEVLESTIPLEMTDRGAQGETVKGGFVITTTLQPGAKLVVRYRFAITLPSKLEVVGGNRRNA